MLIHLEKLGKSFGEKIVLHDVTASVEREDRIGIVGQNGAGKTTLLKILTGEYTDYEGEFSVTHGVTLGYLEQNAKLDPTLDIYGEMRSCFAHVLDAMARMQILERRMAASPEDASLLEQHDALQNIIDAADGYNMDVNIKKVLSGMGFAQDTWTKNIAVLSGGELTRLRLAKLLLEKPDVLILDEPTNHLDFATMEWLENYLKGYSGAVLVVSHDRYFLDNICTRIWEVSFQTMTTYKGNFSAYLPQKEAADALRQKQHDADVALAEKLQDYVDRNLVRASTTKMAQSRRKQLEKLEITEAPKDETNQLKFRFEYDVEPWNELVLMKNLTIRIGERTLLEPFTYTVCRGQRLVIAGPNGAGKSTLMQVLDGKRRPSGGMVRLGTGARPSIFAQQQNRLGQGRVIDVIWNKYPRMTELEVRSHLAKLGFRGETAFKPCEALSGGELARLRFAEIVLERPNLLFLDEPTNHLDIYTRENLTEALMAYTGTLLMVTHDRHLMNSLGCPILYLEDGKATLYPSYDALMGRAAPAAALEKAGDQPAKAGYGKEQRRRRAELRAKIKACEDEMEACGQGKWSLTMRSTPRRSTMTPICSAKRAMSSVICAFIRRNCLLPGKRRWKSKSSTNRLLVKNNPLQRRTMMPHNRRNYNKTHSIALSGLLFALAMALSFIEGTLVIPGLLPGMKLGLANIVVMYALFFMGPKQALVLDVLKAFFVFLVSGWTAGFLSLCGGLLSLLVMWLLYYHCPLRPTWFILSVCGALAHNIGQLLGASVILSTAVSLYYAPVMLVLGLVMGMLTSVTLRAMLPALGRLGYNIQENRKG